MTYLCIFNILQLVTVRRNYIAKENNLLLFYLVII